jgi:hypothetical protein
MKQHVDIIVIKSQREEAERRQLMTKAVKAKARLLH